MGERLGCCALAVLWAMTAAGSAAMAGDAPTLCLEYDIPGNPSGVSCPVEGTTISVDVVLGPSVLPICGAQFFLEYDTVGLVLQSITPGAELPGNPEGAIFSQVLISEIEFFTGAISFAAGGALDAGCNDATHGPAVIARLEFLVRGTCESWGVCFRGNQPPTLLAATGGSKVLPTSCFGPGPVAGTCAPPLRIIPRSDEVVCADPCPCEIDTDCDDERFCDGDERCVDMVCRPGTDSCETAALPMCNENTDSCAECLTGADGRDGLRCTFDQCFDGVIFNTDITDPPPQPAVDHFDCTAEADPNAFCQSMGGDVCNVDGSCECVEPPGLCLTTTGVIDVSTGFVQLSQFSIVTVDVELTATDTPVCAAQFFLRYSPFDFEFFDLTPGSDIPGNPGGQVFGTLLMLNVDDDAGTIDVAIGDDIFSQCANATMGPGIIARLRFRAIGTCETEDICFRTNNPRTLFGQPDGSKLIPSACNNADIDVEDTCAPPVFIDPRDPNIICVPTLSRQGGAILVLAMVMAILVRFKPTTGNHQTEA